MRGRSRTLTKTNNSERMRSRVEIHLEKPRLWPSFCSKHLPTLLVARTLRDLTVEFR